MVQVVKYRFERESDAEQGGSGFCQLDDHSSHITVTGAFSLPLGRAWWDESGGIDR